MEAAKRLCACGCGEMFVPDRISKKYALYHYRGGAGTQNRFMQYVDKTDSCWLWTGSLSVDGYGRYGPLAHRVVYEHLVGPIPAGLDLDHLCHVRRCVNPDHLEPVTHAENIRRNIKTHCKRGHEFTPENTRTNKNGARICKACVRRYSEGFVAVRHRKTHCPQGHPYNEANTYLHNNARHCKECSRERVRAYGRKRRARKRGEAA